MQRIVQFRTRYWPKKGGLLEEMTEIKAQDPKEANYSIVLSLSTLPAKCCIHTHFKTMRPSYHLTSGRALICSSLVAPPRDKNKNKFIATSLRILSMELGMIILGYRLCKELRGGPKRRFLGYLAFVLSYKVSIRYEYFPSINPAAFFS